MSASRDGSTCLCVDPGSSTPTQNLRTGWILSAIAVAYLLVMMDYSIINVALQTIQADFGASNAQLQWMVSGYEILYAALLLPAGFLADRFGRNRILIGGLLIFAAGSGLMATASSPQEIILWRIVMGVGGAVVPATTLAIIKHIFPVSKQSRAMGVWSAVVGASVAVGPILGGFLVQYFAWWSIFLINVPIVAACLVVLVKETPESRTPAAHRLDVLGLLLSGATVGALISGLIRGGETTRWAAWDTGGMMALGVLLLVALVVVERRRVFPMLDIALLRHRAFAAGTLSISLAYFALTGGTFVLVFYIQLIRGQSPFELGLVMLPVAVGAVLGSLLAGRAMVALGPRLTVSIGTAVLAAGFIMFAFADASTDLLWIELAFGAAGLGMGVTMGTTTPLTMSEIDSARAGSAAGLTNTIRGITSIMGVATIGAVYSLRYRAEMAAPLNATSPPLPESANQSLSQTLAAVRDASGLDSGSAAKILDDAETAFVNAFHAGIWVAVAVLGASLLLGLVFLPKKVRA